MMFPLNFFLLIQGLVAVVTGGHIQYECPGAEWTSNGRYCYFFQRNALDFDDAEADCNTESAHLASIHTIEENLFVVDVVNDSPGSNGYYIGLQDTTGSTAWTDGTSTVFSLWRNGDPDFSGTGCAVVANMGASRWRDVGCTESHPYVCKYDKECGGQVTTQWADTTLQPIPGVGVQYHNHAHCTWHFETHQTNLCVRVLFTSMDVQCDFDYVQVYNGRQSNSPALTDKLCGTSSPGNVIATGMYVTMVFVTDGSGTAAGFTLVYSTRNCAAVGDVCNSLIPTNPVTGQLTSHQAFGGADYPARLQCMWHLDASGVGYNTISLSVTSISLQSHPNCIFDFLEIRLGSDETGTFYGRYCGVLSSLIIALPGPNAWLQFVTDDSIQDDGFIMSYTYHDCGGFLTTSAGTVQSNGYPTAYTGGEICAWQIEAPFGYQIQVSFASAFVIDCDDELQLADGEIDSASTLGPYCGLTAPSDFTTETNFLQITFKTYPTSSGAGFQFSYAFVTATSPCRDFEDAQSAQVLLPFDTLVGGVFNDGTYQVSASKGNPFSVQGVKGNAVYLDGTSVLTLGQLDQSCFTDIEQCTNGATLAMWIQYKRSLAGELEMFQVLSNGGKSGSSYGWSIFLDPASNGVGLMIDISTKSHSATLVDLSWSTNSGDIEDTWIHIAITFDNSGISLYKNGKFVRYSKLQLRQNTITTDSNIDMVLGIPFDQQGTSYYSGGGYIDELLFWDSAKDTDFIASLYENYNSERITCSSPFVCIDGSCVCPSGGIDCNATVTITSDTDNASSLPENTMVQFTCSTDAIEPFVLMLMFENDTAVTPAVLGTVNLPELTTTVTLTRQENNGKYFCRASSTLDPSSFIDSDSSFIYNIEYGPDNIMFTTNTPTNVSQPEDTVVEFTCTVEANPYPVISIWRTDALGDDVQLATQTEPSLSFSTQLALRKHFNGEDFYCKVSHSSITVISDEMFSYNITYPALTVNIAGSLPVDELVEANRETIITCIADANPPSTLNIVVTDKLGNVQTSSKVAAEHSLTISLGREYDGASIVCLADPENIFSEILKYEVMYPPSEVLLTPDILTGSSVTEGTVVEFNCSVDANPHPVLSLHFYDGKEEKKASFQTTTNHELIISFTLLKEHSGVKFFCMAALNEPEYHLTSNAVSYIIQYAASKVSISSNIGTGLTVPEDTHVLFTCTTDRHPVGELSLLYNPGSQIVASNNGNSLTVPLQLSRDYHSMLFQCQLNDTSNSDAIVSLGGFQYYIEYDAKNVTITSDASTGSTVHEGTTVTLNCNTDRNPPGYLSLIKYPESEVIVSVIGNSLAHPLLITRDCKDATFKCQASDENSQNYLLSVDGYSYNVEYNAINISISSNIATRSTVPENTQVVFTCNTDQNPEGKLSLIQQPGSQVITTGTANSLTSALQLTRYFHQVLFQCQISDGNFNPLLSPEGFQYYIEYGAYNVTIDSNAATGSTIQEGAIVTFTCDTDRNPPGYISLMKYPDSEVIASQTGNHLSHPLPITRDDNNALFKCQTSDSNLQNSMLSYKGYEYNVEYDAREVLIASDTLEDIPMAENSEVRFTCTTTRNPPGELTLFAESSDQIIHSEVASTFTVPQRLTRVYNQAVFKCSVSNGGNNDVFSSHGYKYNVEFLPTKITMEVSHNQTVDVGTLVTLTCTTDEHNPPQSIIWQTDGRSVEADESTINIGVNYGKIVQSKVMITAEATLNNSNYVCKVGEFSDDYTLTVNEVSESSKNIIIGLGVAGGLLVVGIIAGVAAGIIVNSGSAPVSMAMTKPLTKPSQHMNRSYISRGYRSNPPFYQYYKSQI